jgi:hypothetical protein
MRTRPGARRWPPMRRLPSAAAQSAPRTLPVRRLRPNPHRLRAGSRTRTLEKPPRPVPTIGRHSERGRSQQDPSQHLKQDRMTMLVEERPLAAPAAAPGRRQSGPQPSCLRSSSASASAARSTASTSCGRARIGRRQHQSCPREELHGGRQLHHGNWLRLDRRRRAHAQTDRHRGPDEQ